MVQVGNTVLFFMHLWFMQSLCNACGIRQRKARRAMAAAAAAAVAASGVAAVAASNGGVAAGGAQASDASQAAKPTKEKRAADIDRSLPFKKRCKMVDHPTVSATKAVAGIDAARKNDDDRVLAEDHEQMKRLSQAGPPPAIIHGFTRDDITDAAMLLMSLSCGLVQS